MNLWMHILRGGILTTLMLWTSGAIAASQQYTMGVFPFMPVANIEGLFAPIARDIGDKLQKKVALASAGSFDKFTQEIKEKKYEIAFVQPFDYVQVAKAAGYLPLAARTDILASDIVVKEGSPIKKIQDLKGKTLGMPPENSAMSHLNRHLLFSVGLRPGKDVTFKYLASHLACLQQLVIGDLDACGVSPPVIRLAKTQLKASFTLIHSSPILPSPLFVVRGDIPPDEQKKIKQVLLTTTLESVKPELREMFFTGGQKHPFAETTDKDYDKVRALLKRIR